MPVHFSSTFAVKFLDNVKRREKMAVLIKSCCCGISPRTGCIMIGVLEIIGNIMLFFYDPPALMLADALLGCIVSALLIYGAVKGNRFYSWPSVVRNIITIVGTVIVFCMSLIPVFTSETPRDDLEAMSEHNVLLTMVIVDSLYNALLLLIKIGFTLVIYSHICELREKEEPNKNNINVSPELSEV